MKKIHLSDSVLQKIKNEHIQPHSRSYFVFRTASLIGGGILFFVLGALASAIIFHFLNFNEALDFVMDSPARFLKLFWIGLPLVWLILIIVGGGLALHFSRKTKKGYKISLLVWAAIIFVPQVVAGFFLEQSQIGETADEIMATHMSFYKSIRQRRHELWSQSGEGFLAGTIVKIEDDKIFILDDLHEQEWKVDYSESKYRREEILTEGKKVKMIGEKISENEFKAERIGPWKGGRWKRPFQPPLFMKSGKKGERPFPPDRPFKDKRPERF